MQVERGGGQGVYAVHLALINVQERPFKTALHLSTPHVGFQNFKIDFFLQ